MKFFFIILGFWSLTLVSEQAFGQSQDFPNDQIGLREKVDEIGVIRTLGPEIFFVPNNKELESIELQPYRFPLESLRNKEVRIQGVVKKFDGYPNKVLTDPKIDLTEYEKFEHDESDSKSFETFRHIQKNENGNINELILYSKPLPNTDELISGLGHQINDTLKSAVRGVDSFRTHDPQLGAFHRYERPARANYQGAPRNNIYTEYRQFREGLIHNLNSENVVEVEKLLNFWATSASDKVIGLLEEGGQTELKSIYDFDDSFPSFRLSNMNEQTKSVGGLFYKSGGRPKPICTVTKIHYNAVVTAAHCLKEQVRVSDFKIVFDLKEEADGTVSNYSVHNITGIIGDNHRDRAFLRGGPYTKNNLDYVILTFDNPQTAAFRTPICLQNRPAKKGSMVYSIGHSGGEEQKFHSNGRVFIPYVSLDNFHSDNLVSIATDEFNSVVRRIKAPSSDEIIGNAILGDDLLGDAVVEIAARKAIRVFKSLQSSYHLSENGDTWFYHATNNYMDKMPVMGVSLDVHRGDSGAPVFSIDGKQCLVGVLSGGTGDGVKGIVVSYDYFEKVVPIEAIVDDLDVSRNSVVSKIVASFR